MICRHPGGKATIAKWIVAHLPARRRYVEGFAGAANVLLNKARSPEEVLIERNPGQVALLKAVRDDHVALRRRLEPLRWRYETWLEAKDRLRAGDWGSPLDLAALTFTLRLMGHSGGGGGYSDSPGWDQQGRWYRGVGKLAECHRRLQGVRIVSGDCLDHLHDLDSPETCYYLDPPYVGVGRKIYGRFGLSDETHVELCRRIRQLRGKVALSGYANPIYDRWLSDWRVVSRPVSIRMKGIGRVERVESLWINY
ncbi:DNA adenine methylase [Paludisphaera soli]|uniref:DNA adenine methylase n=1 Tax=Paludisphaera soli TaxID=2712865 RepID=UPI0013EAACA6|nr:DNA adenine methylase [Paludisphaera soli]